ncbi:MAG: WecB/TagA/CpsF family glycosyltransferase [Microthrixaceae bacterium]
MHALPVRTVFGLDFVASDGVTAVADALDAEADRREPGWRCVVTPNVDHLVRYQRFPLEAEVAASATTVLPDGMPIVWASRLLGDPLPARLTGSDLFAEMWPRWTAERTPVVVVAATDDVAAGLASQHPGAAMLVPPLFDESDDESIANLAKAIEDESSRVDARFVVIGVSMPKHHRLAARLERMWSGIDRPTPTVMLLGASAEMHLGATSRAPGWMRRSGLEWLHRLASDPRRMARRYLVDDVAFVGIVFRAWLAERRRRGSGAR